MVGHIFPESCEEVRNIKTLNWMKLVDFLLKNALKKILTYNFRRLKSLKPMCKVKNH